MASDSKSGGRDESNEPGTGRRKITPKKQGKPKIEPDKTQKPGHPKEDK